jgi:hypothetical protein
MTTSRDHLNSLDARLNTTDLGRSLRGGDPMKAAGISAETALLLITCQGLVEIVRELVTETNNLRSQLFDESARPPDVHGAARPSGWG